MSDAIMFKGTTFEISTGNDSPVATVTTTVGYPTIITKASHGLSNGDVVKLSDFAGEDAAFMNGEVLIVSNVTTNTLALNINTTGKIFTSAIGTLTPVTWTEVGEITDCDGPGNGTASVTDVTHVKSTRKEKRMGLPDEGQVSFSLNYVPGDLGQLAMVAARDSQVAESFRITFSDDSDTTATFGGYVLSFGHTGKVDDKWTAKATVEVTGEVTWA